MCEVVFFHSSTLDCRGVSSLLDRALGGQGVEQEEGEEHGKGETNIKLIFSTIGSE